MPFRESRNSLPPPPRGFDHIHRYWNVQHDGVMAKIKPGEYYVTRRGEAITTVLGSCVAACVRDPVAGIGGMNHFMLPAAEGSREEFSSANLRFGTYAMEHLINEIIKLGGRKSQLEFKVFGGANISGIAQSVGETNSHFVCAYLRNEGYRVISRDLGGRHGRKIIYFPASGRTLLKKLSAQDDLIAQDRSEIDKVHRKPVSGEVELFT